MSEDFPDFDGCHRECRIAEVHTLIWGRCERAPESSRPEPTLMLGRVYTAEDGYPAVRFDSIPVSVLATRIEQVLVRAWSQLGADIASAARDVAEDLATLEVKR